MDPYFVEEDNLGLPELSSSGTSPTLMRNISVNAGQTAFLECQVRNLGAKRVSSSSTTTTTAITTYTRKLTISP